MNKNAKAIRKKRIYKINIKSTQKQKSKINIDIKSKKEKKKDSKYIQKTISSCEKTPN